mgnify:CR=1 FL=1
MKTEERTLTINGIELPIREWEKRFLPKVDVRGEHECWPWKGSKTSKGYGRLQFKTQRKTVVSHRLALALKDPSFLLDPANVARHKCDNPSCNNPHHLESGTVADNNRDAFKRKRNRPIGERAAMGVNHYNSKVNEQIVKEMRRLFNTENKSVAELTRRFSYTGITRSGVYHIVKGYSWRDLS